MAELPERLAGLSPEERRALLKQLLDEKTTEARWYPLSPGQRTIWLLHQLEADSNAQNVPLALRILAEMDIAALRRSVQTLVDRHPILRTTYALRGGEPLQQVHERQDVHFETVDAAGWSDAELRERVTDQAYRPFDLEHGPIFRVTLFQQATKQHVLLLAWHHIATDGWSVTRSTAELSQIYRTILRGVQAELPPVPPYTEFVEWQSEQLQTPEGERQARYWRETLSADLPRLNLPTDRPSSFPRGSRARAIEFALDDQLVAAARSLTREWRTTLFVVLLSAFQGLLHRYSQQEFIAVQTPTTGRGNTRFAGSSGFFVNQIVLVARLTEETSLRSLVLETKQHTLEAIEHQDYPLPLVLEQLPPSREPGLSRFSGVVLALRKPLTFGQRVDARASRRSHRWNPSDNTSIDFGGLPVQVLALEPRATGFELDFELIDINPSVGGTVIFNSDLFDEATVRRMAENFKTLLAAAVAEPDRPIADLPLPSTDERKLIESWGSTSSTSPDDETIVDLFEEQIRQTPGAVAAIHGDRRLTFQELDGHANKLADHLVEIGVNRESLVGVFLPRSLDTVVAVVGVLKAGAAYLPIDPSHPKSRISRILEESNVSQVISLSELQDRLPSSVTVIACDRNINPTRRSARSRPPKSKADSLLYVLYTSGSTGEPKGVMGAHGATLNRLYWMWEAYPWCDGDVACLTSGLSFVDSVASIFGALLKGVPLVIVDDETLLDRDHLLKMLHANQVSRMTVVPSLLRTLLYLREPLGVRVPSLRLCACSGEALPVGLARQFLEETPAGTLLNLYGCSEVAGDSCYYEMKPGWDGPRVPIGRPIRNTTVHILDPPGAIVPIGVPGEIFLGCKGLARGYLSRTELTRECFVSRPSSTSTSATLYRTGDRGRYLADGNIEYLGRLDRQVQIRGQRTEPAEIEAVLSAHPAISQAVVAHTADENGDVMLTAYVLLRPESAATNEELRDFIDVRLPSVMVPSSFVFLESFTLTSNGKIDFAKLPKPTIGKLEQGQLLAPPRTPLEELLAAVWSEILAVETVGVHDNFFESGGHSLLATRAISQLSETLRTDIPVRLIFEAPTVARLATLLQRLSTGSQIEKTAAAVVAIAKLSDEEVQARLRARSATRG